MGRGDFPILLQQGLRACSEAYNSSSLYHRNLFFFFIGIVGGSVWGTQQRKSNEARNADCSSVHLTFYDLPHTTREHLRNSAASQQNHKQATEPPTLKRRFEKLWGEAARLLQRQPGYTYTLMFRRVTSAEDVDELSKQQQPNPERQPQASGRKGVGAGLEATFDGEISQNDQQLLDYVEMRVWENEELHQKAQALQMPFLQEMHELGVGMSGGCYRRVFDDALVRIIQ